MLKAGNRSSPYHEAISRLKDVQRTRDVGKAHGADEHGNCHLQQDENHLEIVKSNSYSYLPILHCTASCYVAHLVLESLFPFCKLGWQQPPYAPLQELVGAHLCRVVHLQAGLAQRAFPLVVEAPIYARPGDG